MSGKHCLKNIEAALMTMGEALTIPSHLTLIGSGVCLLNGLSERVTEDIDIWMPTSSFDRLDLIGACKTAKISFDPKGHVGRGLYLQLISEGIVQMGNFDAMISCRVYGKLTLSHPPVENIIASKLTRATHTDISDSQFLMKRFELTVEQIQIACKTLTGLHRETALENLIFLTL